MRQILRKITAIILVVTLAMGLSGCALSPDATKEKSLPTAFTATAEVDFDDTIYEMLLTRWSDGWWNVELTSPAIVSGLIFDVNGEETTISFKGLNFSFDSSKFPVGSVVSLVTKSFDKLVLLELDVTEGEESDYCSGETNGTVYSLTFSKTGIPMVLELGESDDENYMRISFVDFELITSESEDEATDSDEIIIEE
ncbi:MAG: hypothetical protein LUH18_10635 [Oscillospiraceae bacterium]|nr:hypothetical protein [Oscillospiraceae bacterium]